MKDKLQELLKLHSIDQYILEFKNSFYEIPQRQNTLQEEKSGYEQEIEKIRSALTDAEKGRRDLEGELQLEEQKIAERQNRMHEIKTNKEYHAVLKEIEFANKANSERETKVLQLMEEIEANGKDLKVKEEEYQPKFEAISAEENELKKEMELLDLKIKEKEKERAQALGGIDPSFLKTYETIKAKRPAPTMVPVTNYVCGACHMNIPPQQVIELKKYTALLSCSNCQRILYWAEEEMN